MTLRIVTPMAIARQRANWEPESFLASVYMNAHLPEGAQPITPAQINPFVNEEEESETAEGFDLSQLPDHLRERIYKNIKI